MRTRFGSVGSCVVLFSLVAVLSACGGSGEGGPGGTWGVGANPPVATPTPPVVAPSASCDKISGIDGYYPCDLQDAYALPSTYAGYGETVAVVDAFNDPTAETDLAFYRSSFGLPRCTTANGCFRKVDQRGGTHYPSVDTGWAGETALDIQMVSAVCPNCHILLVEADTDDDFNLYVAVNEAVTLGANAVANSYGGSEDASETTTGDTAYNHPGVAMVASSGDNGYDTGGTYPAASPYVTAAGGTSLFSDSSARGWNESAWSGSGSFCSQFEPKPSWQKDTGCEPSAGVGGRMAADVSAVADPDTGVAVYDTTGGSGWLVVGGTSVSAPIIAAAYALAGNTSSINDSSPPYAHLPSILDITSGSNGFCSPDYFCTADVGYDGPTGLGVPIGVNAFASARQASSVRKPHVTTQQIHPGPSARMCRKAPKGHMACDALVRTDVGGFRFRL